MYLSSLFRFKNSTNTIVICDCMQSESHFVRVYVSDSLSLYFSYSLKSWRVRLGTIWKDLAEIPKYLFCRRYSCRRLRSFSLICVVENWGKFVVIQQIYSIHLVWDNILFLPFFPRYFMVYVIHTYRHRHNNLSRDHSNTSISRFSRKICITSSFNLSLYISIETVSNHSRNQI